MLDENKPRIIPARVMIQFLIYFSILGDVTTYDGGKQVSDSGSY